MSKKIDVTRQWDLTNKFRKLSLKQGIHLIDEFDRACRKAFGGECATTIKLMSVPKTSLVTNPHLETPKDYQKRFENAVAFKTENVSDLTKDLWEKALWVNVTVEGGKTDDSLQGGKMELKTACPKTASYLIYGDEEESAQVYSDIVTANKRMKLTRQRHEQVNEHTGVFDTILTMPYNIPQ